MIVNKKFKNFVGRGGALEQLGRLYSKPGATLITLRGRRRIGKSRLVEEFAKDKRFLRFSGIPPTSNTTAQAQRNEFSSQLRLQADVPNINADDWTTLLWLLSEQTKTGQVIILLDEISWVGSLDVDFLGKLKNTWDTYFNKNPELMLILCGSVSSWIEKNIIGSTGFLGRPSLFLTLDELTLNECNQFWEGCQGISAYEKFKVLSVTGGVPRYLELVDPRRSAEDNIHELCFNPSSPLVDEFKHIFADIFGSRSHIYQKIIERLVNGMATANELAERSGMTRTGQFSEYLEDLVLSGFVAKDHIWHIKTGDLSKLSKYRLKDNYLRFCLKYILPNRARIEKGILAEKSLTSLPAWDTIIGLQFENLVINNRSEIIQRLRIKPEDIVFDNPYFQRKTSQQLGCQIDYLIQTRFNCVYVCEIKFSRFEITTEVIADIQQKLDRLKLPRHFSYRPVLITVNGVREDVIDSGFFAEIIDFSELLLSPPTNFG